MIDEIIGEGLVDAAVEIVSGVGELATEVVLEVIDPSSKTEEEKEN